MMKKILFGLTFLAALASCSDDYADWASPQQNAEEAAKAVTMTVGQAPAIDYATLTSDQVQLFNPSVAVAATGEAIGMYLAESTYNVVLWNADKTDSRTLTTTNGYVAADELKAVVEELYGKRPTAHNIAMDITAYTDINGASVANKATSTVTVTLKAPFIDTAYYLVGDFAGWNKESALAFTHIGNGDVYDNPEFQIVFTTTADNQYWKIIPATNYNGDFWAGGETGVVGTKVDGDTSMEGNLTTTDPQAGKIEQAAIYRMTINMMNYTYKLEKMEFAEFIYVPGNAQKYNTSAPGMPSWGWTPELAPALRSAKFDGIYTGYAYMDGEFKFTKERNWNAEYNYDSFTTYSPIFTGNAGSGGNINCTEAGYYQLVADVASGSLKATKLTWGLVGPATPGGWDAGSYTVMNYNMADDCWEITTDLAADEFKFTTNGSWDINLGGSLDDLSEGAGNLRIDAAGNYTIKLYPSRAQNDKMYATVVKN